MNNFVETLDYFTYKDILICTDEYAHYLNDEYTYKESPVWVLDDYTEKGFWSIEDAKVYIDEYL